MVRRLAGLVLAFGLAGCDGRAPESVSEPAPQSAAALVAELVAALPPPAAPAHGVSPRGADRVIAFEVVSPAYYARWLDAPIWPQGVSGVTVGVGYDLGHQIAPVIRDDWQAHIRVDELTQAAGVIGEPARELAATMADVHTPYPLAADVFARATVPRYWRQTVRAFPGVESLRTGARDGLFSLVYNRGAGMAGSSRTEMRTIRADCVPRVDYLCIAGQLRAMARLWRGTPIEAGMVRRREAEAAAVLEDRP